MFTRYHIIRTKKELKQLVKACEKTGIASVDFETNAKGLYTKEFKPTILSVSFQAGSGCSIPLQHFDESLTFLQKGLWLKWLRYFGRKVIENPKITKVAWNWKFDNQIFQLFGIYARGTVIDGMLAKYLLNEERPNDLKSMVKRYLPEFGDYEKYEAFETIAWEKKPLEPLCRYGCMDTDFTLRLSLFLEYKLVKLGFYNLYRNLLMSASRVLQEAEKNGLPFNLEFNDELQIKYRNLIDENTRKLRENKKVKKFEKRMIEKRKEAYIEKMRSEIEELSSDPKKARSVKNREDKISRVMAGEYLTNDEKKLVEPINFNSQKQMVDLLYTKDGFNFPILEYTVDKFKKPTNTPSTAEDVLIKLKSYDKTDFVENLLINRGLEKMNSTYIVNLRELVQGDNCVHPTFLIHGCVSGNTKLIGKEKDIRIKDICPKEVGVLNVEDRNIWILSHEGTWEQVTHTINKGKQPLYKITTKDGDTLRCTKEHKLLTPQGWKRVSYIFKHNLNVVMYDTSKLDITKPVVGKKYDEVIFRDIPGWDGYIASSEGKIYSVKVPGGRGILDYNHPHELVPREWKPGRLRVYLRNNSKKKYSFSVSHLVWMAFNNRLKVPENMVIDHINCNTLDNRPENLQCITYSENIKRAYKYTRTAFTSNSINGTSKFNTLTISKILEDYQNGDTQSNICEKYDISQKQVSGIVNGQRRKDIYLTKLVSMEYEGEKTIYDLSVNDKHSYITRSNFINSNTTSGRLSSRNPNGQNIPKTMVNPDIKKQFITPPGKLFLTYDYSQAELRILAHLAKEDTMLEWFRTGKDIHLASACKKYHEDYDKILPIYSDEQHPDYPIWKKRRKQAKCYSPDTEILTPSGWQRLDSYDGKSLVAQYNFDTEEIEFVKPENYGKVISKNNYTYKDRNISLDITDEHKTLFITRAGKKIKDDFKNLVGRNGYMPVAGYLRKEYLISDNMTRFIAMFISDGNYNGSGKIRFGFKKSRKIERCRSILDNLGIVYTNPHEGKFYLPLKGNEWVYETLAKVSDNKTLRWEILNQCNGDVYLQEAGNWDGHINSYNQVTFSTTIKTTADIMQAMGHLNGYMVSLREQCYEGKGIRYTLGYSLNKKNKARVNLSNAKLYTVPDGKEMWSVTVPSRNLVVRKDNKVVLSGNTINFGIVYEQSAPKLAESLSTPEEPVAVEEAQTFLDDYFKTFPKIKKFMDKQHKFMEDHGYCVSLFGRRRRCPKVYSDKYGEYLEALRQCVDEETEALTTDGWKRYSELYPGQLILTKNPISGYLEWQPIKEVNVYPDYEGDLYSIEGKTFSALTNGKHRWLCNHNSKPGSKSEFVTSEELYKSEVIRPIHRTGKYEGNVKGVLDDNLVSLLGIILTDGHLRYYNDVSKPRYGKPWYVVITQSKKHNIPIIQKLVDNISKRFSCTHKVYGEKHIWKFNKDFATYLDTLIPGKKLTMSLLRTLTKNQIRLLLEGMVLGDGCKHGTRILTSSIEQANIIQVLVVMAGYYSNILVNDNRGIHLSNKIKSGRVVTKNISYLVTIGKNKYFHHRSTRGINHIKKLPNMKQLIWCPTVDNGTWVCRRDSKTYITGNSTNMPCQSAASDMALFASVLVYEKVKKGELPPMTEVNTVHDSVYQFIEPRYITPDTIYKIWDICRNPSTKKFFGFAIKDVDMSMNFTVGRDMAEELPYNPEYDYNKMLSPNFDLNDYYTQYKTARKKYMEKYGVDIENPGCYPLIYKGKVNFNKKRYDEE